MEWGGVGVGVRVEVGVRIEKCMVVCNHGISTWVA